MKHTITFTCETITPMFLSGADGQTPELRPPSIKGALRFWWRAMNGHLSLEELKKKEDEIFGGTEGRSKVVVRVLEPLPKMSFEGENLPTVKKIETYKRAGRVMTKRNGEQISMPSFKISMIDYLTIGLREDNGSNLKRGFIKPNQKIYINLCIKGLPENFNQIRDAFVALSQFGGLGSKCHNGFGCFRIDKMEIDGREEILSPLKLEDLAKGEPTSFTSFSKETQLIRTVIADQNTWESVLAEIGRIYQKARETVENNGIPGWHKYDKRILLTQPIIVNKKEVRETILKDGRHSKPYFLHIDKIKNSNTWRYEGKIYCFPYKFLGGSDYFMQTRLTNYNQAIVDFNTKLNQ